MPKSTNAATAAWRWPSGLLLLAAALGVSGCASDAVAVSDRLAAEAGASRMVVEGVGYHHVVFTRHLSPSVRTLHVYFGGDGRAFVNRYQVARDPTPTRPLALQLMLEDDAPAVYVGRPCYHGPPGDDCQPELWTLRRYSEAVVTSMAAAVTALSRGYPDARITLFGYSGGGVLAVLAAPRIPNVGALVTVAAPLDVAAWTRAHGYTPLYGSMDPARMNGWPDGLRQVHLLGARDRNVPPALVADVEARLAAEGAPAEFRVMEGFDHVCCWRRDWPKILAWLDPGTNASVEWE